MCCFCRWSGRVRRDDAVPKIEMFGVWVCVVLSEICMRLLDFVVCANSSATATATTAEHGAHSAMTRLAAPKFQQTIDCVELCVCSAVRDDVNVIVGVLCV